MPPTPSGCGRPCAPRSTSTRARRGAPASRAGTAGTSGGCSRGWSRRRGSAWPAAARSAARAAGARARARGSSGMRNCSPIEYGRARFGDRPEVRPELAGDLDVLGPAQQDVLGLLIEARQPAQDVADVRADAEVVELARVDRDPHYADWTDYADRGIRRLRRLRRSAQITRGSIHRLRGLRGFSLVVPISRECASRRLSPVILQNTSFEQRHPARMVFARSTRSGSGGAAVRSRGLRRRRDRPRRCTTSTSRHEEDRAAAARKRDAEVDVLRVHEIALVEQAHRLEVVAPHSRQAPLTHSRSPAVARPALDPPRRPTPTPRSIERADDLLPQLAERADRPAEGQLRRPVRVDQPRPRRGRFGCAVERRGPALRCAPGGTTVSGLSSSTKSLVRRADAEVVGAREAEVVAGLDDLHAGQRSRTICRRPVASSALSTTHDGRVVERLGVADDDAGTRRARRARCS